MNDFISNMSIKTCPFLWDQIHFSSTGEVMFCCVYYYAVNAPQAPLSINNEELFTTLMQIRQQTLSALKNGADGDFCTGCPEIIEIHKPVANTSDNAVANWKVNTLLFGTGTVCNLDCIYCSTKKIALTPWREREKNVKRAIDFVRYLQAMNVIDTTTNAVLGSGEITVHPLRAEILQLFTENPCKFLINAVEYSTEVENVLKNGKSRINVSIDSGTPDTYRQIKGGGDYFRTLDNIRRYSRFANITDLKYILLPGTNDDTTNLDGFLDFAKEIGANVILSRDFNGIEAFEQKLEEAEKAIEHFVENAKKRGISHFMSGNMSIGERKEKVRRP